MCKVKCTGSIKLTSAVYTRGADVRFVPGKFRWTCVCYGLSSGNILTSGAYKKEYECSIRLCDAKVRRPDELA